MKYIGAHVSASGGVEFAPVNAHEIGANALLFLQRINVNGYQNHLPLKILIYSRRTGKYNLQRYF